MGALRWRVEKGASRVSGRTDSMKIVSGGQTGADRGALIAAKKLGLPYGGWVPKGRKAEDGCVPLEFDQLQEHPSADYPPRTYANVRDSDATLLVARMPLKGGSSLTLRYVRELNRPVLSLDARTVLDRGQHLYLISCVHSWVVGRMVKTLNVAGSRESSVPGLQAAVAELIEQVLM